MQQSRLLHPELIRSIPFIHKRTARALVRQAAETLDDGSQNDPNVTLVIRTLNEAESLQLLLSDVRSQLFSGKIEVVVVDNESSDQTAQVARNYGAKVITLPRREFTYAKSMNLGVKAASHDLVMLSVGHALLTTNLAFHAVARRFVKDPNVAGVFGQNLPSKNASATEKFIGITDALNVLKPARKQTKVHMGVLGATNCMISKKAWQKCGGFDESYESGGEDAALARSFLAKGYTIIREPLASVHHTHGVKFRDWLKQFSRWQATLKGPRKLEKEKLLSSRPDLRDNLTKDRTSNL